MFRNKLLFLGWAPTYKRDFFCPSMILCVPNLRIPVLLICEPTYMGVGMLEEDKGDEDEMEEEGEREEKEDEKKNHDEKERHEEEDMEWKR